MLLKHWIIGLLSCFCISMHAQVNVLASASMWYDMTKNIGGEHVHVDLIVPIGGDPHIYEPITEDAIKVSKADLILINGLTFEGWIEELIANSGTQAKTQLITKYVAPIASEKYAGATDPHAWMSVKNGLLYCKAIYEALVDIDPDHSSDYLNNYEKYIAKLEKLDLYIRQKITSIPLNQRILITSHDAFKYYGQEYGLTLEAIQGMSTDAQAQKSDMQRVSEAIKKYQVPAVFIESTINPKMLSQMAKDNGVIVGGELYADSLGEPNAEGGTYYGMLKHNTDVIVHALSGGGTLYESKVDDSTPWYLYIVLCAVLCLVLFITLIKVQ